MGPEWWHFVALVAGGIERKERKMNGLHGVVMIVGGMMVAGDLEVLHPEGVLRLGEVLHRGEILVIEMVAEEELLLLEGEMVVVPGEEEKLLRQEEALHLGVERPPGVEETVLLLEGDLHPEETLEIARMVVDLGDLDLEMNQEAEEVEILTVVLQGEVEETLVIGEGLRPDVALLQDVALLPEEISGEMLLIVMEVEPGDEEA